MLRCVETFFYRFCWTGTKRYLITSQTIARVKRVIAGYTTGPSSREDSTDEQVDVDFETSSKHGVDGPVRIRHSSHDLGWQSSHSVDLAGWQAKMASIEIWIP